MKMKALFLSAILATSSLASAAIASNTFNIASGDKLRAEGIIFNAAPYVIAQHADGTLNVSSTKGAPISTTDARVTGALQIAPSLTLIADDGTSTSYRVFTQTWAEDLAAIAQIKARLASTLQPKS